MKKPMAGDFLIYDKSTGTYRADPEQLVRDDVEKHYWKNVVKTVIKDWRLYLMLVPMILVFLFWRYFPMYELLRCFKVADDVKPVADQFFSGFSSFKSLLVGGDQTSTEFWRALRNTFLLSFYGLLFGFPMPIILALFFNEIKSNLLRSAYQVMTYIGTNNAILKVTPYETPDMDTDISFSIPMESAYLFDGETEFVIEEEAMAARA